MDRNNYPFENIFSEFDSEQNGGLSFQDFINMNEFVGVALAKKNLKRVFDIIDKDRTNKIVMEEVRNISNLTLRPDDNDTTGKTGVDELMETAPENLKGGDIMQRHQVNEIYDEIKSVLEHKNVTLEHVFYSQTHGESKDKDLSDTLVMPTQNVTKSGV